MKLLRIVVGMMLMIHSLVLSFWRVEWSIQAGEQIDAMDSNALEDMFSETQADDSTFTYIDAFVSLRKDPKEWETQAEPIRFRQEIIRTFCDTVLRTRDWENISLPREWKTFSLSQDKWFDFYFDHQGYRYDPRQSLMVYAICVPFDERRQPIDARAKMYRDYKSQDFYAKPIQYPTGVNSARDGWFVMNDHRKISVNPLQLLSAWWLPEVSVLDAEQNRDRYPCDPKKDMNRCNFSNRVTTLYQTIMNEYVTMRQAAIYWYRYFDPEAQSPEQEQQLDEAVREFAHKYFMQWEDGDISCNDNAIHYLNAGEVTVVSQDWTVSSSVWDTQQTKVEWNKKHCYHPKTSKRVRDTIKDQANLIDSLEYLQPKKFFELPCDKDKKLLTPHRCAMSTYENLPWNTDMQSFHNMMLNELMWYNLFITYYLNHITSNNSLSTNIGIVSALNQARNEVSILSYEQQLTAKAIETTVRMLNNVQSTYPIHIGLQAYLEDVVLYRKQLAKVYTPMHQLSYLLRNAQECS